MPKSKKEKKENIRQCHLKLTKKQEGEVNRWMFHLYPIWNWAIKILKPEKESKKYPKICRDALSTFTEEGWSPLRACRFHGASKDH